MSLDTQLRDVLDERLDAVVPPVGDLPAAVGRGRRLRRRRRVTAGACGAVLAASAVIGGLALSGPSGSTVDDHAVEPLGPMDFSHGLRAYGDAMTLHIGGRTVDATSLDFLDTDAVATADGVVYYRDGDVMLIREDGTTSVLDRGESTPGEFHPTAKGDTGSLVAYAVSDNDDRVVLKVVDTSSGDVVASRELGCSAPCDGLVIDGVDSGAVFVRDDDGTSVWRFDEGDDLVPFAGPETRVADVRNGVVLYDGAAPEGADSSSWTLVPGAIDAQLTYDGEYVLYWSSRLEATDPSAGPVTLDKGPVEGLGFWTIDTDGTVLTIAPSGGQYAVYDCEVPSGACQELGRLDPQGGDPMFVGNDM